MANYESEAKLEDRMIDQLRRQGYNYIEINDVKELEQNFRNQVNLHNKVELKGKDLSDKEFEKLMIKISGKSIFQSAKELRQKHDIIRDDGTIAYIELFNTKEWCKNLFQVTHQTTVEGNMLDDLLIPDDKRVTIDLHDMELLEAEYYLDKLFETLPEDIQEVVVIHGYRKGQVLLNMVRKDFKHPRIKQKVIPLNKGITLFLV